MGRNIGVRLSIGGLNRLMRGAEAQRKVDEEGNRRAVKAGPKFEYVPRNHPRTAGGIIRPKDGVELSDDERLALLRAGLGSS